MTKVNKKLLSIVAAVVLTAGSALILPELIGGSPEIEITSVVPTQSETETIIEVGMEEEPEEDMDMDIPDSWLVGSMKDEVYAVLGAPDVKTPVKNIDDYRDMDRIEAIKLLWGMEAGGKTYYRVPWEEANDILDGKSEDFKLPYHEYYSDKTHLLFDHTDALYAADFYTDRYSFYGIKVGLTLTEAMEKLKDKESAKFLGYDRGAKATPNASFGVDGITLQLMYSADDEIITEISLWAFVISEWEQ